MTRSRPPHRHPIRTGVDGARTHGRKRDCSRRPTLAGFFLIVGLSILTLSPALAEERASPTLLAEMIGQRADQFASV
ncbi:MAG TPA: hypothetical protein VIT63_06380, partial [Nitrospira sp.]